MAAITLLATGDVAPCRETLASMFDGVRETLHAADLVFGQLETTVTDRGSPASNAKLAMRTRPAAAQVIREAGYDVVSFAGNHSLDWGREGLADTLEHVARAGLKLCGAGPTITEARAPVIIEQGGQTIAFLAYSSILPAGYWAEKTRPGCAPMRGITAYEQVETDQPGTPAKVHSFPNREDLAALRADVRAAKARAEVVVVSIHWGLHFIPSEIADYQRDVAHAAIDDGADVILGHHPHILKGIEVYKGAPIFYGMGDFAIEQPQAFDAAILEHHSFRHLMSLNPDMDPSRVYVGPPDGRMSMIVKLAVDGGKIVRVSYLPVQIDDASEPQVLGPDDPRFAKVADYVARISAEQGLPASFRTDGAEVVVEA